MSESIIVAIITGSISLLGTVITVLTATRKQEQELAVSQAVISEKIETLTDKVNKHNNIMERVYQLESDQKTLFRFTEEMLAKMNKPQE